MRRLTFLAVAAVVAAGLAAPTAARSATPTSGAVGGTSKSTTWTGTATASNPVACVGAGDPTCDHFLLDVTTKRTQDVSIAITGATGDDWDLFVYGPDGSQVAASATSSSNESVVIDGEPAGTYEVRVQPFTVSPGATYDGRAALVRADGSAPIDEEQDCLEAVPTGRGLAVIPVRWSTTRPRGACPGGRPDCLPRNRDLQHRHCPPMRHWASRCARCPTRR